MKMKVKARQMRTLEYAIVEYVILGLVDAQIIYEDVYAIHDVYK